MRKLIALLVAASMPAFAQSPQHEKDRKDFVIEALTSQRDTALRDAAACYADASGMIAKLQIEITELKSPKKDEPAKDAPK